MLLKSILIKCVIDNKMDEDNDEYGKDVIYTNLFGNESMGKQPEQNHTPIPQQTTFQSTIQSPNKRRRGRRSLSQDEKNWLTGGQNLVGPFGATMNTNPQYQGGEMRPVGPLNATINPNPQYQGGQMGLVGPLNATINPNPQYQGGGGGQM